MFRGFGRLHAHSLLHKQAELTELEEQLEELDKSDAEETRWKLHSHINTDANYGTRKELMDKIDLKMKECGLCLSSLLSMMAKGLMFPDDLLLRYLQVQTLHKPSEQLHRGLFNYIFNEHPVTQDNECFIFQKDDFVMNNKGSKYSWLDEVFLRFIDSEGSNLLKVSFKTEIIAVN
jgi:hypothetical protein